MNSENNIVILANGLFPSTQRGLDILKSAEMLICCDGAADKLLVSGMTPHVIIGDLDSVSDETREQYASIMIHSEDQESNDLTKAVRYCIEQGHPSLTILGATGLREDHTLGNISLMLEYAPEIDVRMISDFGTFLLIHSGEELRSFPGEKISFFSVDNRVCVTSNGLKYPLNHMPLSNWYTASLNEATSDSFSLDFESERPLILFRAWPD